MEELIQRCSWATTDLYKEYHDNEWGKPVHDENKLFEMLILEGMQAGLSWLTILNKRPAKKSQVEIFKAMQFVKMPHQTKPLRISKMRRRPANALW